RPRRDGEAHRGQWRQVFLRPRRRAPRQFRAQVQGPGRGDLRYFKTRLAGNGRLQEIIRTPAVAAAFHRPPCARARSRELESVQRRTRSAPSPLVGEGWGGGVVQRDSDGATCEGIALPPPQPLPTRERGCPRVSRDNDIFSLA